jgi:hypothetical protein
LLIDVQLARVFAFGETTTCRFASMPATRVDWTALDAGARTLGAGDWVELRDIETSSGMQDNA